MYQRIMSASADESGQTVAATCQTCRRHLTVEEFRACAGRGHYCADHLSGAPRAAASRSAAAVRPRTTRKRAPRRPAVSASGAADYPCKAQFARDGVIRRGRLMTDHPSCVDGAAVFVSKGIGYGPTEIVTLFIKDPVGRELARRAGYECHV